MVWYCFINLTFIFVLCLLLPFATSSEFVVITHQPSIFQPKSKLRFVRFPFYSRMILLQTRSARFSHTRGAPKAIPIFGHWPKNGRFLISIRNCWKMKTSTTDVVHLTSSKQIIVYFSIVSPSLLATMTTYTSHYIHPYTLLCIHSRSHSIRQTSVVRVTFLLYYFILPLCRKSIEYRIS